MLLNLVVWLFGLLITAVPIVIVFAANLIPGAAGMNDMTILDVARQAYPNILFVVIAVSGVAIAEAVIVFFRMIETGQQRATAALWLLCVVLLIIYGSIAYGKIAGSSFIPSAISSQQITLAFMAAIVALMAALSLRFSMLQLEAVARQQIHDDVAAAPIDLGIDRPGAYSQLEEDPYDLGGLRAAREATQDNGESTDTPNPDPNPVKTKGASASKKK
jgi:hypothetical protein